MRRIRTRLVAAFVAVALLPAVPLAILVRDLLERSFAPPFAEETADALEAALEDSRARLHRVGREFERDVRETIAPSILAGTYGEDSRAGRLHGALRDGDTHLRLSPGETPRHAPPDLIAWAEAREREGPEEGTDGPERVGDRLAMTVAGPDALWILARPLPEGLAGRAGRIVETIALLRAFREDRAAVLRGFVLPFLLSYALLLAVAVLVGIHLARRIARPVEALAAGAARVGSGDLETRVETPATGEVRRLVDAFNRMVADLSVQRDELARLERAAAWRDLARSLAHEIKNPLTPIQLAVQQLGDAVPPATAAAGPGTEEARYRALLHECVDIVNEEVEALRRLVREFSEFSRLPEPSPEPGDLTALLDEIVRLYGGEKVNRTGADGVRAVFDPPELKRALINLVDNGLAACRTAGRAERVELRADAGGVAVLIHVTDQGTGVAPENAARIFEPNFSTKSEGMGLGLAIVEGIVHGHGGAIRVDGRPGEGAEFTVELPAAGREEER